MNRYGALASIVPVVEKLTRAPGQSLIIAAVLTDLAVLFLGWQVAPHDKPGTWGPFIIGLLCAVPIGMFAIRRRRLENRVKAAAATQPPAGGANPTGDANLADSIVIVEENPFAPERVNGPHPDDLKAEWERVERNQRQRAAEVEATNRRDVFMPGLEAAQRAAIAAAGGIDKVPYLKDDLRWTLLSGIGTALSMPLLFVTSLIALFMLL